MSIVDVPALNVATADNRYLRTVPAWQPSTAYTQGQVVSYAGAIWSAVNVMTSGTTFNPANWSAVTAPLGIMPGTTSSQWIQPYGLTSTTTYTFTANGYALYAPFYVPVTMTIDIIGCSITTAGGAGALLRLGLLRSDSLLWPNLVLNDAGTVDATVTGQRSITGLAMVLQPGLYWGVVAVQGVPSTYPVIRSSNPSFSAPAATQALLNGNGLTFYNASVTGALGSSLPPTATVAGAATPIIQLHRSA